MGAPANMVPEAFELVGKRRDTADLDMDLERPSSSVPTGSATSA